MVNSFAHIELHTNDPEGSKVFYSKLLGLEFQEAPMGDGGTYTMFGGGDKGVGGGIIKNMAEEHGVPSHWLPYVLVEDVKATSSKLQELGGKILMDITEIAGMGRFFVAQDNVGAAIAFWQDTKAKE